MSSKRHPSVLRNGHQFLDDRSHCLPQRRENGIIRPQPAIHGKGWVAGLVDNQEAIWSWGIGMITATKIWIFSVALFVLLIVSICFGYHLGRQPRRKGAGAQGDGGNSGVSHISGTVFTLIGLLLGFTLSGAATGFQQRQVLIAQEANAIGTAYLRLDLLPKSAYYLAWR